jgi:hypothetical protein
VSDYYLGLSLQPTEALQLIADVAGEIDLVHLSALQTEITHGELSTEAAILVPDTRTQIGSRRQYKEQEEAFDRLIARSQELFPPELFPSRAPQRRLRQEDASSLASGLVQMLEYSGAQKEHVTPEPGTFLVVAQGMDVTRATAICSDLRFHATHSRFAVTEARIDESDEWQRCFLFHIRDDRDRRSSFGSAVAGNFFGDCAVLSAYSTGGRLIFLSGDVTPAAAALSHFSRIVQAAPQLFGGNGAVADHELLLASHRPASQNGAKPAAFVWYLAHLPFQSCVALEPRRTPQQADFKVVKLTVSDGILTSLRVRIAEAARRPEEYVGYKLELRPTRYREWSDVAYEKLQTEVINLEYQLAYMESIARPRPKLLRFTQRQLPALADLLRSYPLSTLRRGDLLYGFQANDDGREGFHFLFIPPNVVNGRADPLHRWEYLDHSPMSFWLDPFWGKYYHQSPTQSLIFVPEQTTLFPSMHDWDVDNMDSYLREMMGRWFHGQHGVAAIPEQPIYIFDGIAKPGERIRISVLDYKAFQPLTTQLGWINDNLVAMDGIKIEPLIRQMARDLARSELAQNVQQRAEDAESSLATSAEEIRQKLASHTTDLTESVTQELKRMIAETEESARLLQELDWRLKRLRQLHVEMTALAENADAVVGRTQAEVTATLQDNADLQVRAWAAIEESAQVRQEVTNKVNSEIDALRRTRDSLLNRLRRM